MLTDLRPHLKLTFEAPIPLFDILKGDINLNSPRQLTDGGLNSFTGRGNY